VIDEVAVVAQRPRFVELFGKIERGMHA
jgi:hypothetical protein